MTVNKARRVRRTPLDKQPDPELGNDIIAKERYTSAEFMRLEWQRMWTKVWLLGGLEIDLTEPGDYIVTEIGPESILIVKQADKSIRAFYNVCQHRGNRLRPAGLGSAESFQCAYHHWEYRLDGSFKRVPDEETFPQGRPCVGLEEIPCDTWGGFVFFSLNPKVEPLEDYLGVIPEHLDPYNFKAMALQEDVTIEWDCNWKTSVDAFNESYHVQGIHPQLLYHLDDINIQIDCYDKHSRYLIPFATLSPRVPMPPEIPPGIRQLMLEAGMEPADYEGKTKDVRKDLQQWKREHGPGQGKDYSRLHDEQLTDDYHYMIFPNITMNAHADDLWLFRQRPHATDPNKMYFDFWLFALVPDGEEWPTQRPRHDHFIHGEKKTHLVIRQDAANLPGVQAGMNSLGYRGLWLGKQELRIRHFHKALDDYIYGKDKKPQGAL